MQDLESIYRNFFFVYVQMRPASAYGMVPPFRLKTTLLIEIIGQKRKVPMATLKQSKSCRHASFANNSIFQWVKIYTEPSAKKKPGNHVLRGPAALSSDGAAHLKPSTPTILAITSSTFAFFSIFSGSTQLSYSQIFFRCFINRHLVLLFCASPVCPGTISVRSFAKSFAHKSSAGYGWELSIATLDCRRVFLRHLFDFNLGLSVYIYILYI